MGNTFGDELKTESSPPITASSPPMNASSPSPPMAPSSPPVAASTKESRALMEGSTDVTPPPVVDVKEILERTNEAQELLYRTLKTRGYCLLKVGPEVLEISQRLTKVAFEYFEQDLETKNKNHEKDGHNLGFVQIPGVREYIKVRPSDPEELWPTYPLNFKEVFNSFFQEYSKIAFTTFELLSQYVEEGDTKPLISPENVKIIQPFLAVKSSLSMIKYYELKKPTEVCAEHTDTGILTFITCTNIPSLEIWDAQEQKYIKIEEFLQEGDVIVFIGEKVPLFSCSKKFTATPHRVRMGPGGERLSIAFLLDVAK